MQDNAPILGDVGRPSDYYQIPTHGYNLIAASLDAPCSLNFNIVTPFSAFARVFLETVPAFVTAMFSG